MVEDHSQKFDIERLEDHVEPSEDLVFDKAQSSSVWSTILEKVKKRRKGQSLSPIDDKKPRHTETNQSKETGHYNYKKFLMVLVLLAVLFPIERQLYYVAPATIEAVISYFEGDRGEAFSEFQHGLRTLDPQAQSVILELIDRIDEDAPVPGAERVVLDVVKSLYGADPDFHQYSEDWAYQDSLLLRQEFVVTETKAELDPILNELNFEQEIFEKISQEYPELIDEETQDIRLGSHLLPTFNEFSLESSQESFEQFFLEMAFFETALNNFEPQTEMEQLLKDQGLILYPAFRNTVRNLVTQDNGNSEATQILQKSFSLLAQLLEEPEDVDLKEMGSLYSEELLTYYYLDLTGFTDDLDSAERLNFFIQYQNETPFGVRRGVASQFFLGQEYLSRHRDSQLSADEIAVETEQYFRYHEDFVGGLARYGLADNPIALRVLLRFTLLQYPSEDSDLLMQEMADVFTAHPEVTTEDLILFIDSLARIDNLFRDEEIVRKKPTLLEYADGYYVLEDENLTSAARGFSVLASLIFDIPLDEVTNAIANSPIIIEDINQLSDLLYMIQELEVGEQRTVLLSEVLDLVVAVKQTGVSDRKATDVANFIVSFDRYRYNKRRNFFNPDNITNFNEYMNENRLFKDPDVDANIWLALASILSGRGVDMNSDKFNEMVERFFEVVPSDLLRSLFEGSADWGPTRVGKPIEILISRVFDDTLIDDYEQLAAVNPAYRSVETIYQGEPFFISIEGVVSAIDLSATKMSTEYNSGDMKIPPNTVSATFVWHFGFTQEGNNLRGPIQYVAQVDENGDLQVLNSVVEGPANIVSPANIDNKFLAIKDGKIVFGVFSDYVTTDQTLEEATQVLEEEGFTTVFVPNFFYDADAENPWAGKPGLKGHFQSFLITLDSGEVFLFQGDLDFADYRSEDTEANDRRMGEAFLELLADELTKVGFPVQAGQIRSIIVTDPAHGSQHGWLDEEGEEKVGFAGGIAESNTLNLLVGVKP